MEPYNQFICGHDGDALEIRNDATSGTYQPAQWLIDWATGGKNDAGVAVNGYTALTHAPIWQGVNIISSDFGQTPVRLLRNKYDEQKNHPSWNLLRVRPNRLQTPLIWKQTMMQWALIWGNGVSWIRRQGSRPVELIPLRPDCLWHRVMAFEDEEVLLYHYRSPYPEGTGGTTYTFFPWEVVHFQGLTSDGVWGYPLWQVGRNTIGHGLALQKHSNKQFSNGARPGGVLEHPQKLSPEARDNLRKDWNSVHSGSDNAGKIAILWEGMKFNPISSSNVETELIELVKLDVYHAAALLNLPPHKLGAMDGAKYNNVEEQNADYKNQSLNLHYTRANQEYKNKLLTEKELLSDEYDYEHDSDCVLMGDMDTKSAIADRNVKATIWNPNEAREYLGYRPRAGGEVYGSPAITPGTNNENSPSSAGKTPKQPPKETAAGKRLSRNITIVNSINWTIARESAALQSAAHTKKDFIGWLDAFYGTKSRRGAICDILDEQFMDFDGTRGEYQKIKRKFNNWAQKRRESVMQLCDSATKEELAECVENFIHVLDHINSRAFARGEEWGIGKWDSE